ncbi:Calcium uniporter protein, mitochondrial Precursor [Channa argus]|uniref:Calcium uniporter protein, mitochondrial n=1 Tax=Channa argus TaxID=215402 RepID=A0A6G1R1W2_CHAAH|nr:Calcium uniporter protein, mitochondrial Precursor [Channa argus]
MAAKVCRSVLLLSRSSGAVAGSLPALVVSSQRHHQHIRPAYLSVSAALVAVCEFECDPVDGVGLFLQ